jgi:Domain of unknown function (DUF4365)
MTNRTQSHILEARSRDRVRTAFHDLGFVVDDLHQDYGEDMLVRIFKDGFATPYSFFVQVKATEKLKNADVVRLRTLHIRHWKRLIQPVFVIVWNATTESATWEAISHAIEDSSIDLIQQKTLSVHIPQGNRFDEDGIRRMANIARTRFDMARRERDGSALLRELLEKHTKLKVSEYSAHDEALVLKYPDGHYEFCIFGEFAEMLHLMGLNGKKFKKYLFEHIQKTHVKVEGENGPIVYFDDNGREIHRFTTRAEQVFFNRVKEESIDMEELLKQEETSVALKKRTRQLERTIKNLELKLHSLKTND